jgi:hypothetical protein
MKRFTRARLRLLLLSWATIFVVAMLPFGLLLTWGGGVLRAVIGFWSVLAFTWTGLYWIFGPRAARRWWLTFRFVMANWSRVDVIVARGEHRPVSPRRPQESA